MDYTVTRQQILNGERIYIDDARLPRTVRVRLASWMEEGTLLSITPGEGTSSFGEFYIRLHVEEDPWTREPVYQPAPQPRQPVYQPAPQPREPGYQPAPQPQQPTYRPAPQPQQPVRQAAPQTQGYQTPESAHCSFRLDVPEKITGFRMGGDDDGNVDVYPDRLELYKKSTTVALAFGAIGSALEGKGKLYFTLYPHMVVNFQKQLNKKGTLDYFLFSLNDGRMLRLRMNGKWNAASAIERLFYR